MSIVQNQREYDTVAERLRRSTRNRLGFSRVGSSPAGVDTFWNLEWQTFSLFAVIGLLKRLRKYAL